MQELAPAYLSDLAAQIGYLSAFLGGFAATLLGVLLFADKRPAVTLVAIALATAAAAAFIVSVIASTQLIAALHPAAPANVASVGASPTARLLAFVSFAAGVYALLGSIGVAGWIRRRRGHHHDIDRRDRRRARDARPRQLARRQRETR